MLEIGKMHLQLSATPLVLTLAYTSHGNCIYYGASLLTSGTIKECSKFLDALDWLIRTQQSRQARRQSSGWHGSVLCVRCEAPSSRREDLHEN